MSELGHVLWHLLKSCCPVSKISTRITRNLLLSTVSSPPENTVPSNKSNESVTALITPPIQNAVDLERV